MIGHLSGPRIGALVYNAGHTYAVPMMSGAAALVLNHALTGGVALAWGGHIGMDRGLGCGLKRLGGFHDTHLSGGGGTVRR